ncbi:hypothetical protein LAZ67_3000001, partial [Cordylochernes scorpioides]
MESDLTRMKISRKWCKVFFTHFLRVPIKRVFTSCQNDGEDYSLREQHSTVRNGELDSTVCSEGATLHSVKVRKNYSTVSSEGIALYSV